MKGNKINWQDLAAELAASAGIPRKDAEAFVRTFFDVLGKGVLADKSVKVKALGTFKLVEVQERESVNVNTGERITISGHSKIGFLPDNVLKELVNKPFADFQTVILNEGTTLEDIEKINKKYPAEETNEDNSDEASLGTAASEDPIGLTEESTKEEGFTEDFPETEEFPEPIESAETQEPAEKEESAETAEAKEIAEAAETEEETEVIIPAAATPSAEEPQEMDEIEPQESSEPQASEEQEKQEPAQQVAPLKQETTTAPQMESKTPHHRHNIWRTLFLTLVSMLLMIACYMAGYLRLIDMSWLCIPPAEETTETSEQPVTPEQENAKQKATEVQTEKVTAQEEKAVAQGEKKPETQPQPQADRTLTDRNAYMEASKHFPQLAGGKFLIVGIRKTRAMKRGDNLYRMAKEEYDDKSIAEYIKVLNQFPNPDNIPIGYEVKLPELFEMGK